MSYVTFKDDIAYLNAYKEVFVETGNDYPSIIKDSFTPEMKTVSYEVGKMKNPDNSVMTKADYEAAQKYFKELVPSDANSLGGLLTPIIAIGIFLTIIPTYMFIWSLFS